MSSGNNLAIVVLAACACNRVLGLSPAQPFDATYFDAAQDAAFACPPLGAQPPRFEPSLHQLFSQDCDEYLPVASGRAVGRCYDPNDATTTPRIVEGPVGQPLTVPVPETGQVEPRLFPDGNTLYVLRIGAPPVIVAYTRVGGVWRAAADPGVTTTSVLLSTIAQTPDGYHRLFTFNPPSDLDEWSDATGGWQVAHVHPTSEIGLAPNAMLLATDGLRALVSGGSSVDKIWYTDRPTVDSPFRAVVAIDGVPESVQYAVLTDDCARVYISGVGSIFYVQQR